MKLIMQYNLTTRISTREDNTLIERITLHDDYRAFEVLFHKYYNRLCRYAHSIIRKYDAAEEIVNDVFLKIWRTRELFVIRSSVQAYLVTATRNLTIDRVRAAMRQRHKSEEIMGDFIGDYASPYEAIVGEEVHSIIENSINALPPQGKLIFRMSRDKGMTYNEIADLLGLSIKTIETHMGRSLRVLRKSLHLQGVINVENRYGVVA
jgi:RNA polymerase sigma-70 factor, ECF subfamily